MTTNQKSLAGGWKNSLWLFWTFTFVLNWVAFFYIGARGKRPLWMMAGFVYAIPTVLLLVLDRSSSSWVWDALVVLVLGLVSIIHAFLVRMEYLRLLVEEREKQVRKYQSLQSLIGESEPEPKAESATTDPTVEAAPPPASGPRLNAISNVATDAGTDVPSSPVPEPAPPSDLPAAPTPSPVRQTTSQKIDAFVLDEPTDEARSRSSVQTLHAQPLSIINLNSASAEEIASIPSLTLLHGMTAVSIRETQGQFTTLEQFVDCIGLKSHVADRIRPYVNL
ncbi:helix-hairpin-helix domain-containing protein [Tumebacillus sp. ITR2]|uniref:Helix-hairpin-helix domain-containing protein n=1 Tax=Tumebacillus amylolyticus TaxID=2801339 RepID=A0ABS1J4V6_9BACL|nr:helix-hairpin-helix domain-containing protein [Tumebacillus amylolyticus]MBL0385308.1 helix-hairpin-helix domain-containing protein [Tumebacillus amylolyticus]